jgi:hypothetical protein
MLQSHPIDIDGVFVGAAVRLDRGYRFIAINMRVEELDQTIWPTLADVQRLARRLYLDGTFGPHDAQQRTPNLRSVAWCFPDVTSRREMIRRARRGEVSLAPICEPQARDGGKPPPPRQASTLTLARLAGRHRTRPQATEFRVVHGDFSFWAGGSNIFVDSARGSYPVFLSAKYVFRPTPINCVTGGPDDRTIPRLWT